MLLPVLETSLPRSHDTLASDISAQKTDVLGRNCIITKSLPKFAKTLTKNLKLKNIYGVYLIVLPSDQNDLNAQTQSPNQSISVTLRSKSLFGKIFRTLFTIAHLNKPILR